MLENDLPCVTQQDRSKVLLVSDDPPDGLVDGPGGLLAVPGLTTQALQTNSKQCHSGQLGAGCYIHRAGFYTHKMFHQNHKSPPYDPTYAYWHHSTIAGNSEGTSRSIVNWSNSFFKHVECEYYSLGRNMARQCQPCCWVVPNIFIHCIQREKQTSFAMNCYNVKHPCT